MTEAGVAIDSQESIRLLERLVAVPSPSGREHEAVQQLVAWMQAHGLEAHVDAVGNAVGRRGSGPRELVLLGHIDTVPGEISVQQIGDRLYGRGTVDAKGPLCTFAVAAAAVSLPSDWSLLIVGAVEEEAATSRGARHLLQEASDGSARRVPGACIIGEPSRWDRITLGYKGRLLLSYRRRAPLSHSAGQEPLAAERAVAFWNGLREHAQEWNRRGSVRRVFEMLSISLRSINTQDIGTENVATMDIGWRLPLRLAPAELIASVEAWTERGGFTDEHTRLSFFGAEPAFTAPKNTPLVRALLYGIRAQGGSPRFVYKTGTSDMNVVGPAWGCPIAAYGPGDSALDHTPEEHIELREYLRSIQVLQTAIEHLVGVGD